MGNSKSITLDLATLGVNLFDILKSFLRGYALFCEIYIINQRFKDSPKGIIDILVETSWMEGG